MAERSLQRAQLRPAQSDQRGIEGPLGVPHTLSTLPRHPLTQLPAAHVIELSAEKQGGNDMDD